MEKQPEQNKDRFYVAEKSDQGDVVCHDCADLVVSIAEAAQAGRFPVCQKCHDRRVRLAARSQAKGFILGI